MGIHADNLGKNNPFKMFLETSFILRREAQYKMNNLIQYETDDGRFISSRRRKKSTRINAFLEATEARS